MSYQPEPKPDPPSGKKVNVSPAQSARPTSSRIAQPMRPAETGFRLRPLDLALIALTLLAVAAVAIVFVTYSNGTSSAPPAAGANSGQTAANSGQSTNPLTVGQLAPDFTLTSTDGSMVSLSQFKGKVVLLEFMAPWCPHCQQDSVTLNQVYDNYAGKNVQMLGVSASPYGRNHESGDNSPINMGDLTWFHDTFHLKYPLLFDPTANVGEQAYGVQSYPTIYVLDGKDVILAEPDYPVTYAAISTALDQALK
ncbi:MAG: peroxiredoxin family protein [Chloroflexia bacterium]